MSRKQGFISLIPEQVSVLEIGYKTGSCHLFRRKCQRLLQSHSGKTVQELSVLHKVTVISIYHWFNAFEKNGIVGLQLKAGRGRKPKLSVHNEIHRSKIKSYIANEPQSVRKIIPLIEQDLGILLSSKTLKRFLKNLSSDGNVFGKS
jgi:transposase